MQKLEHPKLHRVKLVVRVFFADEYDVLSRSCSANVRGEIG